MDLKTAIRIANLVFDIEKVGDMKHQFLNTLEDVDILSLPSEGSMEKIIEEVNKAFDNVLGKLEEELRSY